MEFPMERDTVEVRITSQDKSERWDMDHQTSVMGRTGGEDTWLPGLSQEGLGYKSHQQKFMAKHFQPFITPSVCLSVFLSVSHTHMYLKVRRQLVGSWSSLSNMWVLGTELGLASLRATPLPAEPSHRP